MPPLVQVIRKEVSKREPLVIRVFEKDFHVHKKHYVIVGVVLFAAGIIILGDKFTMGVVCARVVDAVADVIFEKGFDA